MMRADGPRRAAGPRARPARRRRRSRPTAPAPRASRAPCGRTATGRPATRPRARRLRDPANHSSSWRATARSRPARVADNGRDIDRPVVEPDAVHTVVAGDDDDLTDRRLLRPPSAVLGSARGSRRAALTAHLLHQCNAHQRTRASLKVAPPARSDRVSGTSAFAVSPQGSARHHKPFGIVTTPRRRSGSTRIGSSISPCALNTRTVAVFDASRRGVVGVDPHDRPRARRTRRTSC